MTKEEKATAVGRTLLEYGEVKEELAVILAEADTLGTLLHEVASYLTRSLGGGLGGGLMFGEEMPSELNDLPDPQRIRNLCTQALELYERKNRLGKSLKDMGYEQID